MESLAGLGFGTDNHEPSEIQEARTLVVLSSFPHSFLVSTLAPFDPPSAEASLIPGGLADEIVSLATRASGRPVRDAPVRGPLLLLAAATEPGRAPIR